jgi:CheY-like chemotaxis protein
MTANGQTPRYRVLIVDDCPDTAGSLAILLRLWGHEVQVTHDGPSALRAIPALQPGVVLLDIGMPGMSGWEVARRIRQQEGGRDILLVALSGYGQEQDQHHSREVGCDLHLVKPFDPDELLRVLQTPRRSDGLYANSPCPTSLLFFG